MLHSKNLENITRLTVKGHMTEMVPGALASFQSLRTLILDGNALTQIDPAWLSPDTSAALKVLSLSGNHIEVLSGSTLGGLSGLTRLNLSRNRIREVDPASFRPQTRLVSLDLSRNRLTRVSPQVLGSVGTAVWRLAGNPWDCSCGAADSVDLIRGVSRFRSCDARHACYWSRNQQKTRRSK
ncbi:leucine-rich repeat-containing protein 26-like [Gadus chalcogrammus]|uniref:leucine-rich repeat-containing protein 26-like n=1 Tax=Gadus chalcogrammus TaxID=1042646 RepID=UPI0024C4BBA6|nr:leucine-rich repeat-containing protein 26-like [Gadus chalcogrammus]